MAYIKRGKLTIVNDNNLKNDLLIELNQNPDIKSTKARQLIYYTTPMSAIRWARWLTPAQIEKYLVPVDEVNDGSNVVNDEIDIDNMGI